MDHMGWNFSSAPANITITKYFNYEYTIVDKIFEANFSYEIMQYGESSISIFQKFFVNIDKILILGKRLSIRL